MLSRGCPASAWIAGIEGPRSLTTDSCMPMSGKLMPARLLFLFFSPFLVFQAKRSVQRAQRNDLNVNYFYPSGRVWYMAHGTYI